MVNFVVLVTGAFIGPTLFVIVGEDVYSALVPKIGIILALAGSDFELTVVAYFLVFGVGRVDGANFFLLLYLEDKKGRGYSLNNKETEKLIMYTYYQEII